MRLPSDVPVKEVQGSGWPKVAPGMLGPALCANEYGPCRRADSEVERDDHDSLGVVVFAGTSHGLRGQHWLPPRHGIRRAVHQTVRAASAPSVGWGNSCGMTAYSHA